MHNTILQQLDFFDTCPARLLPYRMRNHRNGFLRNFRYSIHSDTCQDDPRAAFSFGNTAPKFPRNLLPELPEQKSQQKASLPVP